MDPFQRRQLLGRDCKDKTAEHESKLIQRHGRRGARAPLNSIA
jgi:hypothetical protein